MRFLWVTILAGCYSTVPIRPSEVAKMNGMYVSYGPGAVVSAGNIAVGGSTPASISFTTVETDRSHIDFVTPDGATENVPGYADLIVATPGRTYRFREPVKVDDEGDRLMLRSSSRSGEIAKSDIRATELHQLDRVKTVFAVTAAALALTAPLVVLIVAR